MEQTTIKINNDMGLYKRPSFNFAKNSVNVLIGPNGTGKTQLLFALKKYFEENNIMFVSHSNLLDGGNIGMQRFLDTGRIEALAMSAFKSEGQQMMRILGNGFLYQLRRTLKKEALSENPRDTLWILIDSMDSGLDIHNMREVINLFDLILEKEPSRSPFLKNIYIVVAANAYEFVRGRTVIDVLTGKNIKFGSYEEYAEHIENTVKLVDDRDEKLDKKESRRRGKR